MLILLMDSTEYYHFYTPVEDGTYHGIIRGGRAGGVQAASSFLSGAYLQNYST